MVPEEKHPPPSPSSRAQAGSGGQRSLSTERRPASLPNAATVPSQAFTEPPRRRDRLGTWLLLVVCVALAAPGMLIELHKPDVIDRAEARCIATSIESWRRCTQSTGADGLVMDRFVPYLNGEPELRLPPGLTWLHMAAFSIPVAEQTSTEGLILKTRLVSVAVALMSVAAVYWAGLSVGG